MSTLLVIIPDVLSSLVKKGEITPRYYNPGNLFDEVHILTTEDDDVKPVDLQDTVGSARLFLHKLPLRHEHLIQYTPFFKPWLLQPWAQPLLDLAKNYQFQLLNRWASPAIELAKEIKPDIIRCHANDYNAYAALRIKKQLGIPYVVSLHINPDINPRRRHINPPTWQDQLFARIFDAVECAGLLGADLALPVYEPIIPYLERVGCQKYEVAYNVLSPHLRKKNSYHLHKPIKLLSVGRHFAIKDPENILRAVKNLSGVHFTLVGDGPLQEYLETLANELELGEKVEFIPAIPNLQLCNMLPDYDIFVIHTEHWELSKALLEALLTGLPVILNYREGQGGDPPELREGDFVKFVRNTPEDYQNAIQNLIDDHIERERLGKAAYSIAQEKWSPQKTEAKYAEIYKKVMADAKK